MPATSKPRRTSAPAAPVPARIGIALAGGGPLGAVYEIGALAAIEEAIEGLDLNDAAVYVGISAGGIIAAGLANGITPHEMARLFIESDDDDHPSPLFRPELLLKPAWGEWSRRAAGLPLLVGGALFDYLRRGGKTSMARSFERLKEALPAGIFSGAGIERFMRETFSARGRTNDFRKLGKRLVLIATDLDSGESVAFGSPGHEHVPISVAAQASAAVPGMFAPVEIDGHHFVDGALKKTLHASMVMDEGVNLVLCLNPIVPFNAKRHHGPGRLARDGMLTVLSQALRTIIQSRVEIGMANYALRYPQADILLFEPSQDDAEMFFTNLFSTTNRRRMCENAYQNTRAMLWERRAELNAKLARHGLALKEAVLRDASLTLVPQKPGQRSDEGSAALAATLDRLERHLKVAGA